MDQRCLSTSLAANWGFLFTFNLANLSSIVSSMSPINPAYAGSASPLPSDSFTFIFEIIALAIALAAFLAILMTGCYGPLGWNNEWPLIRDLPFSWKCHIYPSRVDDPVELVEAESFSEVNSNKASKSSTSTKINSCKTTVDK